MNKEHINKSPISCETQSKSHLPCGGGLGVGIIPQGYKQTSIGIIPQDWEVVCLGEVCDFIKTYQNARSDLSDYDEINYIHYGEIHTKYKHFIDFSKAKLPKINAQKLAKEIQEIAFCQNGDLVVVDASEDYTAIAKSAEIQNLDSRAVAGLHTFLLRDKAKHFVSGFKGYILYNSEVYKELKRLATGISVLSVSKANLSNLQIPLPPLKEQEKIARILGVWDSAIDSLANLIKAKRKYKTALMQRLLTPPKNKNTPHSKSLPQGEGLVHKMESKSPHCESDFGKSDSIKTPLPCGGGLGVGIKTDKSPSHRPLAPYMKEFSRTMRKNPTQAENKLWQELRGKKIGFGFRRQFVIDSKYIADFVCLEKRLIIECDGGQHNKYESPHHKSLPQGEGLSLDSTHCKMESKSPLPQHEWDLGVGNDMLNHPDIQRDFYLESQNFRILRFWNNEILGNLEGVLSVIKEALESNWDFANAKYTCESTHPLAPSAREGEREVSHHTNEGEVEKAPPLSRGVWGGVSAPNDEEQEKCLRAGEGECVESPRANKGESHQSSLRFAGFTDKWQEFRLGDLFEITRGYVLPIKEIRKQQDKQYCYPVYSSQTINGGLMGYYTDYLFEDCITWTTDGANAGEVNFRAGKFYCTNVCGVLISKDGFANKCVAEIINSVSKKYVSYVGNPKLMNNVMSDIKVKIPTLAEQKKIAQVLSACDKEIETLNLKFECLKAQKKGLMQQLLSGKVRVKC